MRIIPDVDPCVVVDCQNNLGESVLWDDRTERLWWINIHAGEIWSWAPAGSASPRVMPVGERVGAIGLREGAGLVLALENGFALFEPETGALRRLGNVEEDLPTTRLNDGRVDPAGRFLCGGMDEGAPQRPISALYSLDLTGRIVRRIDGVACANSLCWSPGGETLYFTDMPTRLIKAFDYDASTGEISHPRVFANLSGEPGLADGSVVDAEGFLWNAQWGGAKIVRYAPDGTVDRQISLPVTQPSCLTFGGPDLDILFITSAWFGLTATQRQTQPNAGSLFALNPGVRGCRERRFAG